MLEGSVGDLDTLSAWLSQTAEIERVGARFLTLAESLPAAVLVMTRDRVLVANDHVTRLVGVAAMELPRVPLARLFPDRALRATVREALGRGWEGAPADLGVIPIARPDGGSHYAAVAIRPLPREIEPTLMIVLAEGGTATQPGDSGRGVGRRTHNEALRIFGLYLAALANDLRKPLTAYLGHLSALTDRSDLPPDLREAFHLYRQITAETLERLARAMEWGRRGPLDESVDLREIAEGALATMESETFFTGEIRVDVGLEAVPRVAGFADQLQLATEHVLRNACEALRGRGGSIRLTVGADERRVLVTVADDGPGIPDSLFPHVFEPFSSTKSIAAGLGLGLPIVKDIVHRHRGEVFLESGSTGTTVALAFPAVDERRSPPRASGPRVLIVDDNIELQETLRLLIQRAGFEVITVGDADEALDVIGRQPVDVLLVDVQLAGRDGLAIVEALATWHPSLLTQTALQTAYAYESRVQAVARRYGVTVLAKPCSVDAVIDTVRRLAGEPGETGR